MVCASSLRRKASQALDIRVLDQSALVRTGLFTRKWIVDGAQCVDLADGKAFSSEFSFSRFLVPILMQQFGVALYCDSDFLFLSDVVKLFDLFDPRYAVQVVKHQHQPAPGMKMDGQRQEAYPRKNWSSLVLWNCAHEAHHRFAVDHVNRAPGAWLHAFEWLDDDEIGELPTEWNYLVGVSDPGLCRAAHFTLGTPDIVECSFIIGDRWREELARALG